MFLEFNWTAGVYQVRVGNTFTDWRGYRSFDSLDEAKYVIGLAGCRLRKTDSRTWAIECKDASQ